MAPEIKGTHETQGGFFDGLLGGITGFLGVLPRAFPPPDHQPSCRAHACRPLARHDTGVKAQRTRRTARGSAT